jgi:hypothetical protein
MAKYAAAGSAKWPITLTPGDVTILGPALSTTGDALPYFAIPATPARIISQTLLIVAALTGSPTTVTASVQVSADGGTTWEPFASALDMTKPETVQNLVPGMLYKINLGTLSGGSSPTVQFSVALG